MSGNHYPHIPPPINTHSVSANKQKNDFVGPPPPSVNQWAVGHPNEFENREKYMETQLTEELYNSCNLDSNANQNEIADDDPCPPPGLRRLVTGQTVSFDDGPASPPFDRIIPGEGNAFNNYPQPPKPTKPPIDPYANDNIDLSQPYVSGGTNKDYNSQPYQSFAPPPSSKKDSVSTYNNNNFYNPVENNTFNSSTQDFFDTYLQGNNASHDVENITKSNQYPKNKFVNLQSGFQNYDADKRDNYFQNDKLGNTPKPSSNTFADDFSNKNINPNFQHNFPPRSNNHMPPDNKAHQPLENIPYNSADSKTNDDAYSVNRRSSFDNFGHDAPPFAFNYDSNYNQKHNAIPPRTYAEENVPQNVEMKNRNESSNYPPSAHKPAENFHVYYPATNKAENTSNENKYLDNQPHENTEKMMFHSRSDFDRNKKDDLSYNLNTGRMAVEGSSDNVSYSKPPPSASMQMQSPNYDYWYSNNSQKSFTEPSEHKNTTNDQTKLLQEQNAFYGNKNRNDKPHNLQNVPPSLLDNVPPRLISPASAASPASANPYDNTSMHSKTQSMSSNTSSLNENQENFGNPEESFTNRDPLRKELHQTSDRSFIDQRKPTNANLEVLPGSDGINKEVNLKSPYRKNSLVGNEERIGNEGLSLERGTVPGAQSTPNDVQPNRSFMNANNSSNYSSTNLFKTIEDEEVREETARYSDSDEKPINRRTVLGYHSNTIPGPRSVSRKFGRDGKLGKMNKMKPPLEGRMVVGETSSDAPTAPSNRLRDDGAYEEDKPRHLHTKDKDPSGVRYDRDRKKPLYRRDHRKPESDDEDYEEFGDRAYDNSSDRESRSFIDKHYRGSPRHMDKRSSRRDRESSFTQSQDEFYFDDDEDDYDPYRNRHRYYDRRYPRDSGYKQYESFYREGFRDRRGDYYGRYEDESFYGGGRTSRPSSRSGSEYRRDLDYGNQRFYNRPPYYEYLDHRHLVNFIGGPRMPKRETEYWSKVREMEPQKYMNWFKATFPKEYLEWYSRHVTGKVLQTSSTYQDNRRGSGHSGQSSGNDATSVVEEKLLDPVRDRPPFKGAEPEMSTLHETRCTPAKFTVPHVKGIFNALNQLLVVNACSPQDGQPAVIDFYQIPSSENDPDFTEFLNFSGPFIVGETHVNTLSEFVRYHANVTSHPSAKLLYQLIELIIKLRGVTDGIAISELLMENYRESQKFNSVAPKEDVKLVNNCPPQSETEIIEKYTELLLLGNKNAALEYAVNNKLWGHAFLLASKMGSKHYSKVLAKFDNSISMNNPLKTLYQLYSKQIPQAATACADEKWGDWRPHLAMMLSNPTSDGEFDKQAIITLGDSLACKDVFASHFCYLAAQADFEPPTKPSAKYTLLSLRNSVDNFGVNVPNHPVMLTQVYEFAKRLQKKDFTISALLPYKYLLATRLVDYGKVHVALQYLESIALDLMQSTTDRDEELIYNVIELSEQLRYSDAKPLEGYSSSEKQWLISLRQFADNGYDDNQISHSTPWNEQPSYTEPQSQYSEQSFTQQQTQILGQQQYVKPTPQLVQNEAQSPLFINQSTSVNQPTSLPPLNVAPQSQQNDRRPSQPWDSNFNVQEQRNIMSPDYGYTPPDQYNNVPLNKNNESADVNNTLNQQHNDQYGQTGVADNSQNYYSPWEPPQQHPVVTMPSHSKFSYYEQDDKKKALPAEPSHNHKEEHQPSQITNKDNDRNTKDKKSENDNNSSGWLGGIFGKFIPRPKNEMKLPDDKNPSIVWSEEKKRWVDKNGDDDDGDNALKPPPKASDLKAFQPQVNQSGRPNEIPAASNPSFAPDRNKPPSAGSNNVYKLSRGKGMKANYVNVLSQSTTPPNVNLPPPGMMDYSKTQVPSNMKLFVPLSDGPSSIPNDLPSNSKAPDNSQTRSANPDMPMFFNPAQYST